MSTIDQYAAQQNTIARIRGGALSQIEAIVQGELPCYHDAEWLREKIAQAIADCKEEIVYAKKAYLAAQPKVQTLAEMEQENTDGFRNK